MLYLLSRQYPVLCSPGLFRTHIGSSTTSLDAQVYDSPESMVHFAKFASVYAHLSGYRQELLREAAATGHPLVR